MGFILSLVWLNYKMFNFAIAVKPELKIHPQIVTTCQHRPLYRDPILDLYNINDLLTMTTCQQRPLFWVVVHKF